MSNVRRCNAALVVSVVAGIFVSVGCTKISSQISAGSGNAWTIPGVLRLGMAQEPDNLNPVLGQQAVDVDISMFWAGYLIGHDDRGQFIPELAADVPSLQNGGISRDGRTITYRLRGGVVWQDGTPFTPDDVIFTWHAVMNPNNPVPSRVGYELIQSITKQNAHSIVIHLSRPYAPFVATFLSPVAAYAYCVLPAHLLARYPNIMHAGYNIMPVGTGPYRIAQYEPDNHIRLVANDHYWRGKPNLKEVDIRIIPSDNTLATLIKTHEIDMYYRVPHEITRTLHNIAGITIVSSPFTRYNDLGLNLANPVLSDVRVRQALAYASDKQTLLAKVTNASDILTDTDQPSFLWAHNNKVTHYHYDPARAARLLDAAGWHLGPDGVRYRNGTPLRLGLSGIAGDSVSMMARELLQQQWRQVGIDTEIKSYPSDILFAPASEGGIELSGHFDVVLEGFANGVDPDDSVLFECRWLPPRGENVYRFCDPSLDAAEEAALASNVLTVRKAAYDRVQDILADKVPVIPLWFDTYDYAINTDLRNFKPAHVGSPFWNTWALQI